MSRYMLSLPYETPPKGLSGNCRGHWAPKAKSTHEVRTKVCAWAESEVEPTQRVQVELVWVVNNKRVRDEDNLWPLLKAICDGLGANKGVTARIVADDAPEFMVKLGPRIEYRPDETPHMEVVVTDITHRTDPINEVTRVRLGENKENT